MITIKKKPLRYNNEISNLTIVGECIVYPIEAVVAVHTFGMTYD